MEKEKSGKSVFEVGTELDILFEEGSLNQLTYMVLQIDLKADLNNFLKSATMTEGIILPQNKPQEIDIYRLPYGFSAQEQEKMS
ncbi:hypothetical protein PUN28_013995 [Cardiocondyla obscurior]|uniref:Uncharacterized protein n=1 Tax=Cardiocondyla obscurior TaxID=286306 RepID=A0AAW2F6N4_9HYME